MASGIAADLQGLGSSSFHFWDGVFQLNRVSPDTNDKLDWNSLENIIGPDLAGNNLINSSTGLDETLDIHLEGNVVFDIADGAVVGRAVEDSGVPGFTLSMGQIEATDDGDETFDADFADDEAISLIINNADLWFGSGGSLLDNDGGIATPANFADDTVSNGTVG